MSFLALFLGEKKGNGLLDTRFFYIRPGVFCQPWLVGYKAVLGFPKVASVKRKATGFLHRQLHSKIPKSH